MGVRLTIISIVIFIVAFIVMCYTVDDPDESGRNLLKYSLITMGIAVLLFILAGAL